ncbi:MAG TPA: hypothetical protein VK826_02075, partial [Bacteroidia bacterium]|nr:hypothetical protein [Bacteroidia bacterium]
MPTSPHARLYLSPSLQIHLARNPGGLNAVPLKLFLRGFTSARSLNYTLTEVPLTATMVSIARVGAGAVMTAFDATTSTLSISAATGRGSDQITITHTVGTQTLTLIAEVTVHDRLNEWWFGIDSLTVPRDDFSAGVAN